MKKLLVIFITVMFLAPAIMNAQIKLAVGPVAGINYNSYSGSDLHNATWNGMGLFAGVQADLELAGMIGIEGNFLAIDNRYASTSSTDNPGTSFSYFTVDVLLKWKPTIVGLYVLVGPSFSLSTTATGYEGSSSAKITNANSLFSLKGGVGFDFKVSSSIVISPVVMASWSTTNLVPDSNVKVFTVSAGCALKFNIL